MILNSHMASSVSNNNIINKFKLKFVAASVYYNTNAFIYPCNYKSEKEEEHSCLQACNKVKVLQVLNRLD